MAYVAELDPETRAVVDPGTRSGRFSVDERLTHDLTNTAVGTNEAMVRALERYFGS
jgi:hypothetical protein